MRLENRTAIVTGGAGGIGRAIAIGFAREGANVIIASPRDPGKWTPDGLPVTEVIRRAGGKAELIPTDAASWDSIDACVSRTVDKYGRLDIMVMSAAVFNATNILDTTEEDFDALMAVNLRGMFLCSKRAIQQMIKQEPDKVGVRGRLIPVTSQHGMVGPPNFFAYAVAKGGTIQLTRQLATDYVKHGILVNAVAPGRILTGTHPGEGYGIAPEAQGLEGGLDYSRSRTPYPRLGEVEDCVGAAVYLASDECTFVSGINLLVDGGWMSY